MDRLYRHAQKFPEYSLELPRRGVDLATEFIREEFGSEHDVLSLARIKVDGDPEIRKDYPGGVPNEHLRVELSGDRVRISGEIVPLYAYLYHLRDTLNSVHSAVALRLADEYLESTADLLRKHGLDIDAEDLRKKVKTLADAYDLYNSVATAPDWFWDYVRIHSLSPLDVAEHMIAGRVNREFWQLLGEHPELRQVLHPDFAPYLSGKAKAKARRSLVERKAVLANVDPRLISRAIRALGAKNVLRILVHPDIPPEQVADVLSKDVPLPELEYRLRLLLREHSLDKYAKRLSKDLGENPRISKHLSLYRNHPVLQHLSKHLPDELLRDPSVVHAFAKAYDADRDVRRALVTIPDVLSAQPIQQLLERYTSTGNPIYLRRAVNLLSEYGRMLRYLPREPQVVQTKSDARDWERLIRKDPVYRPIREELSKSGVDVSQILEDLVPLVRSMAGDDISWARNPRNAKIVFDAIRRHFIQKGSSSTGRSATRMTNKMFYAGAAAEAISRLLELYGDKVNIWRHPHGYVVISMRGLRDHDAKFVAKVPDYLQKASGISVPMELRETHIRIPADKLDRVVFALKVLEGKLRGDSRKKVRRFRRVLESMV